MSSRIRTPLPKRSNVKRQVTLMGMDKIAGGSPFARPNILDKFQVGKKDKEEAGRTNDAGNSLSNSAPVADTAEISDTAQTLVDLRAAVDTGRAALASEPEVREEKLAQVRQRLQDGHYQTAEVQDELSGILTGVLGRLDNL